MPMIDFANAWYAGVVAGGVTAILFVLGRALGLIADSEMMLGTILVGRPPALVWATGAAMSIVISGLVGLLYAAGFEYVTYGPSVVAGIGLAVAHTAVSGLALAAMPVVHPLMRMHMWNKPGIFKSNLSALDTCAFVGLHLLYGAIVGALYDPSAGPLAAAAR